MQSGWTDRERGDKRNRYPQYGQSPRLYDDEYMKETIPYCNKRKKEKMHHRKKDRVVSKVTRRESKKSLSFCHG